MNWTEEHDIEKRREGANSFREVNILPQRMTSSRKDKKKGEKQDKKDKKQLRRTCIRSAPKCRALDITNYLNPQLEVRYSRTLIFNIHSHNIKAKKDEKWDPSTNIISEGYPKVTVLVDPDPPPFQPNLQISSRPNKYSKSHIITPLSYSRKENFSLTPTILFPAIFPIFWFYRRRTIIPFSSPDAELHVVGYITP